MKKYRTKARPEPNNEIWEKKVLGKTFVAERPHYNYKKYDKDLLSRAFKKEPIIIFGKNLPHHFDNKGVWWIHKKIGSQELSNYYMKHPLKYIKIINQKIKTTKNIIKTLKNMEKEIYTNSIVKLLDNFKILDKCVEDFYSYLFTTYIIYDEIVLRLKKLLTKHLGEEKSNIYMSEFLRAEITKEAIKYNAVGESTNRDNKHILYAESEPIIFYKEPKLFFEFEKDNEILRIMENKGVSEKFLALRLIAPISIQISEEAQYIESKMLLPMLRITMKKIEQILNPKKNIQNLTRNEIVKKLENISRKTKSIKILKGLPVSSGKVIGKVKIIKKFEDHKNFNEGDILITKITNPTMTEIMMKSKGIICEIGGLTSHPSILSREMGIPCIVSVNKVTTKLKDGDIIQMDGKRGKIIILGN